MVLIVGTRSTILSRHMSRYTRCLFLRRCSYDLTYAFSQPDAPGLARSATPSNPNTERAVQTAVDGPIFDIKDLPGKGKGLVAKVDISKGAHILSEKPLFAAEAPIFTDPESLIAAKLSKLPKNAQRQFLSLYNRSPGKMPFTNIFKTNALPCGVGSTTGAICLTICRINHSCFPNAHHSWNDAAEHETVYAIRPIKAGEEITIAYTEASPSVERRAKLKRDFKFDCDCRMCSLPPAEAQRSDARQLRIRALDDAIGNPMGDPSKALQNCRLLLRTLKAEYDGHVEPHNARLYYDAFQICIAHGDQARAGVFAKKAYEARTVCEGDDSPEARRMKAFSRQPASHPAFGLCSRKWMTGKGKVPKGLDEAVFEEWLFGA